MRGTGLASTRSAARGVLVEKFILPRGHDDDNRGHAGNTRNTRRFRIAVLLAVLAKFWLLQELIDINYIAKTQPAIGPE